MQTKNKTDLPKLNYGKVDLTRDIKDQPIRFAQAYHEIKTQSKHSNYRAELLSKDEQIRQLRNALSILNDRSYKIQDDATTQCLELSPVLFRFLKTI